MKQKICLLFALLSLPFALSAKPDMPGGKPDMPNGKMEKPAKPDTDQPDMKNPVEDAKEKEMPNQSDKSDAIRKEAGKGSEKGQEMREKKSRKWWKFWGE